MAFVVVPSEFEFDSQVLPAICVLVLAKNLWQSLLVKHTLANVMRAVCRKSDGKIISILEMFMAIL